METEAPAARFAIRRRRHARVPPGSPRAPATLLLVLIGLMAGLAHAFIHDGKSFAIEAALPQLELEENPFVLREEWWNGELKAGENKIMQHQLFKRNEYWFWAGGSIEACEVSIHVYNAEGTLVDAEAFQRGNVAGVRVVPDKTGSYYLRVAVEKSEENPVEWAVIYAYR